MCPDIDEPPEIIRAVRATQLGRLRQLLEQGIDPDSRSRGEPTALHAAAEEGILEAARLLLDAGAQVDARNWAGETPLHCVARNGRGGDLLDPDLEMRPLSREHALDLRVAAVMAEELAHRAPGLLSDPSLTAPIGDLGTKLRLIVSGVSMMAIRSGVTDSSVLYEASGVGDLAMIELLLARGVDPNHTGDGQRTPLENAISFRRLDVAKVLRRAGAEIDRPGMRALHVAAAMRCLTATGVRTVDYVRWPLDEGAAVDGTAGYTTPLILAAGTSDAERVQVLLEHGARVEARNGQGETALVVAARALSLDVVRLLIATGARVDARDSAGGTVLHALAGQDSNGLECPELLEMLRLLIAHGADLAARDDEGRRALDVALAAALPADVIALLENKGGD